MTIARQLIDAINRTGRKAKSYSGRGTSDRRCVGYIIERGTDFEAGVSLALAAESDLRRALPGLYVRSDDLGYDTVIYFPDADWPDAVDSGGELDQPGVDADDYGLLDDDADEGSDAVVEVVDVDGSGRLTAEIGRYPLPLPGRAYEVDG